MDGAFYLYADVSRFTNDSIDFAKRMLEQAGVAATPGLDFDPLHGKEFLRFCYAGSAADMREAVAADRRVDGGGEGMNAVAKLPVFRTAFLSWRDGLAALRDMPMMPAVIFVVMAVDTAMNEALRQAATADTVLLLQLLRLAISIFLLSFFLAPAAIAINRYVLLGDDRAELTFRTYPVRAFADILDIAFSINLVVLIPLTLGGGEHGYL